jgi:lysophospholipid acyltransferase (LPLAT)-like uncharacterized protein
MKIRQPWLIKAVGWAGAWAIRLWIGTLRYQYRALGPNVHPDRLHLRERLIGAFWHENILLPAYLYGRPDIWVLISQHADGQMIAEVCRRLGFGLVRGSTTRGGAEAVRQMLRGAGNAFLALTPDGPRGPRRRVQPGLIYLASRTGMPILPMGMAFQRAWRLNSWDRFALPRPWSRATYVTGTLIAVPPDADKDQLAYYRQLVEDRMHAVTALAELWVRAGKWPGEGDEGRQEQAA